MRVLSIEANMGGSPGEASRSDPWRFPWPAGKTGQQKFSAKKRFVQKTELPAKAAVAQNVWVEKLQPSV